MKKTIKLWQGIVLLVLTAIIVFFVSPVLYLYFGFYGTALGEILMLVCSIVVALLARANLKAVFQFRRPELKKICGTILMWIGSYLMTMAVAVIMEYLFPTQMAEVNSSLQEGIMSVEMAAALLIVSLSPAVCEEMVFRGVFFNSVWNKTHKKWATILIVGIVFGIFHGSVWRFVPTAILGIVMGYILFETNNMFYNMLFHAINNAFPVLMMFAVDTSSAASQVETMLEDPEAYQKMLLPGLGIYLFMAAIGLLILYVGRNMICYRSPYQNPEAARAKKQKELAFLICGEILLVSAGFGITVIGTYLTL